MDIQPSLSQNSSASAAQSTASLSGSESSLSADFTTFLTLLTTQLRNQDPLKPVDSTEFIAQLASFSSVEQQTRTNTLLEQMAAGDQNGNSLEQAASWVGREVLAVGPANFDGKTEIAFATQPPTGADRAELLIKNDFGLVVTKQNVDPTEGQVTWDGRDAAGAVQANGLYSASILYFDGDTQIADLPGQTYGRVSEARLESGQAQLILESGTKVSPDAVKAIRAAPES